MNKKYFKSSYVVIFLFVTFCGGLRAADSGLPVSADHP